MKDALIIGDGPAGVSAALYIARANLGLTVVGKGESALIRAERIANYYGMKESPTGRELYESGLAQLAALGVEYVRDQAVSVEYDGNFITTLQGGQTLKSRALLLCTGAKRVRPDIEGLGRLEGRGVSYCAVCDAFFYRGKDVGVLGNGAYALHEAETLLPVAGSVTLFTNGAAQEAHFPENIPIVTQRLTSLAGEEKLGGAALEDGSLHKLDGLFIALGTAGAADIARKLGAEVRGTDIVTDGGMATMLPGLYAAGDCAGGVLQVSVAVGEGAKAALSAIRFLRETKK